MLITLRSIGDLREYFGRDPQTVELPEGSTVQHLLAAIEQRFAPRFPAYLWDFEQHCFRGPVVLLENKKVIRELSASLREGMEITIMRALVGG